MSGVCKLTMQESARLLAPERSFKVSVNVLDGGVTGADGDVAVPSAADDEAEDDEDKAEDEDDVDEGDGDDWTLMVVTPPTFSPDAEAGVGVGVGVATLQRTATLPLHSVAEKHEAPVPAPRFQTLKRHAYQNLPLPLKNTDPTNQVRSRVLAPPRRR